MTRAIESVVALTRYHVYDQDFRTERDADEWKRCVEECDEANALLNAGATLGAVADRFPFSPDRFYGFNAKAMTEAMRALTKNHLVKISHWQCIDQPAYSLGEIRAKQSRWDLWFGGGGYVVGREWPGGYGSTVALVELADYAPTAVLRKAA